MSNDTMPTASAAIVTLCVYNPATGRILRVVRCAPDAAEHQIRAGESAIEGESDDLVHYVRDGVITPRAEIAATCAATWPADDTTPLVIAGLPIGARVHWGGPDGSAGDLVASDGSVALITNAPGAYRFVVDEPAYQSLRLDATATL